jgi:hypothetical protein
MGDFTLADHDNQTDAQLTLTLALIHFPGSTFRWNGVSRLNHSVSTAINQQEEDPGFWHAVLPVLFWLCSENSEGKTGKPVRPAPRRVGKHQRLIPPDKPVQIFAGAGPVPRSGRHRERRKPVLQGTVLPRPIGACAPMSEKPTGKATGRANPLRGGEKYAAEMEATTNRQWRRRFSGSGREIYERD